MIIDFCIQIIPYEYNNIITTPYLAFTVLFLVWSTGSTNDSVLGSEKCVMNSFFRLIYWMTVLWRVVIYLSFLRRVVKCSFPFYGLAKNKLVLNFFLGTGYSSYYIKTNQHQCKEFQLNFYDVSIDSKVKSKEKLASVVANDQKAPSSIATTPRYRGGCNSFPWIVPLYPWYLPYISEC